MQAQGLKVLSPHALCWIDEVLLLLGHYDTPIFASRTAAAGVCVWALRHAASPTAKVCHRHARQNDKGSLCSAAHHASAIQIDKIDI